MSDTPAINRSDDYERLIKRLERAEYIYKSGDVDEPLKVQDDSGTRWAFEKELNEIYDEVCTFKSRLLAESPAEYYKFLAIQNESREYYDSADPAFLLDRYLLAKQLYRELPKQVSPDASATERVTLKNIIRVIITGLEHLHVAGEFGPAMTYAEDLHDFVVNRGLMTKDDPANGTRAVLYYFMGRTLRQRGIDDDNERAIEYFYRCSEAYFDMARRLRHSKVDVVYARTRAMVSLAFGAGFLFHNSKSDLVRAKAEVVQARFAFLQDNGTICCQLHYYYLELLYASILRAEAGDLAMEDEAEVDDSHRAAIKSKLERASEILTQCEEALQYNSKYYAHVIINRALVEMYQGPKHYDRAREAIDQLIVISQDNPRITAHAYTLKSHLERRMGNFDVALADAISAYNQAGNHPPVRMEALLARGQAQMAREQFSAARSDFERTLRLNNGANFKFTALACLLLAELFIKQKELGEAFERFNDVKTLIPSISHGYILRKYSQVEKQLAEMQSDFVISGDTVHVDYKQYETGLQRWLLMKVLREEPNVTRAAERLNISKKTVYMWLEKFKLSL
jgi:tetratricopeptide (TPR) repeat protein